MKKLTPKQKRLVVELLFKKLIENGYSIADLIAKPLSFFDYEKVISKIIEIEFEFITDNCKDDVSGISFRAKELLYSFDYICEGLYTDLRTKVYIEISKKGVDISNINLIRG